MKSLVSSVRRSSSGNAFTLIELLVVIGLIGVLAGVIGLSLGTGDRGVALQNAQSTISSALSGVRGQAALNLTNAALFVNATPGKDGFLQELRIAVDTDPTNAENWEVRGDAMLLSSGVYIVPASTAFSGTTEVVFDTTSGAWTDLYSTAYSDTDVTLKDGAGNTIATGVVFHRLVNLSVRGTTTSGQLVLSPADISSNGLVTFKNPSLVRGVKISKYGITTGIQDADGFKP